ncbi:MAG: hypothetical protein VX463_07360, partial [Pseudomonadota bacterium]|nr:hypothetical protein [Pseudomonadota bacterium]
MAIHAVAMGEFGLGEGVDLDLKATADGVRGPRLAQQRDKRRMLRLRRAPFDGGGVAQRLVVLEIAQRASGRRRAAQQGDQLGRRPERGGMFDPRGSGRSRRRISACRAARRPWPGAGVASRGRGAERDPARPGGSARLSGRLL